MAAIVDELLAIVNADRRLSAPREEVDRMIS